MGVLAALVLSAVSITPASAVGGFGDVPAGAYYAEGVQWMVDEGITTGTSPGCFSPGEATTRGQVATFVHRYLGEPGGGSEPFTDVGANDFFRDAVAWMVGSGVTTGVTPTTFEPYRLVTRGELATFLHRIEGEPGGFSEPFTDVHAGHFFREAVAWMVGTGLTSGTSSTTFEPYRAVTRAEIAAFLHRLAGEPAVAVTADGVCGPTGFEAELAEAEARSFARLNDLRAALGRSRLVRDPAMDAFARDWSREMDDTDDFRHSGGPWAENIAWWSADWASPVASADQMHEMWVDSSGHYANMTRTQWTRVGVGFWRSDDGWHATHVFAG